MADSAFGCGRKWGDCHLNVSIITFTGENMNDKPTYNFLDDLEDHINEILLKKDRVIVCITGKKGVGKSVLGKNTNE